MFESEIEPGSPMTPTEMVALGAIILFSLAGIAAGFGVFT